MFVSFYEDFDVNVLKLLPLNCPGHEIVVWLQMCVLICHRMFRYQINYQ